MNLRQLHVFLVSFSQPYRWLLLFRLVGKKKDLGRAIIWFLLNNRSITRKNIFHFSFQFVLEIALYNSELNMPTHEMLLLYSSTCMYVAGCGVEKLVFTDSDIRKIFDCIQCNLVPGHDISKNRRKCKATYVQNHRNRSFASYPTSRLLSNLSTVNRTGRLSRFEIYQKYDTPKMD